MEESNVHVTNYRYDSNLLDRVDTGDSGRLCSRNSSCAAVGGMAGQALSMTVSEMVTLPAFVPLPREAAAQALSWHAPLESGLTGAIFGLLFGTAQWLLL